MSSACRGCCRFVIRWSLICQVVLDASATGPGQWQVVASVRNRLRRGRAVTPDVASLSCVHRTRTSGGAFIGLAGYASMAFCV